MPERAAGSQGGLYYYVKAENALGGRTIYVAYIAGLPIPTTSRNSRESEAVVSTGSIRIRQCHHPPVPKPAQPYWTPGTGETPDFPFPPPALPWNSRKRGSHFTRAPMGFLLSGLASCFFSFDATTTIHTAAAAVTAKYGEDTPQV